MLKSGRAVNQICFCRQLQLLWNNSRLSATPGPEGSPSFHLQLLTLADKSAFHKRTCEYSFQALEGCRRNSHRT